MTHKDPNILIQVVFSTRKRRDLIPQETLPRLFRYFAGIGRNHRIPVLAAGGTSNHSHLLIVVPSDMPVAKAVQVLNGELLALARRTWLGFCVAGGIRSVQRQ
jgi:putative transposase